MCISTRLIAGVVSIFFLACSFTLGAPSCQAQQIEKAEKPKHFSPADVRSEFAALKKDNVPWRQIQWKTCLLEGLNASRQQQKPLLLWIFIDRPIDDERC